MAADRPRRVRTGCLTCRDRHLKCDEARPVCLNCRKSNRNCVRGIKLNFIDTNCRRPPTLLVSQVLHAKFLDESRDIASEYRGGLSRYAPPQTLPQTLPATAPPLAVQLPEYHHRRTQSLDSFRFRPLTPVELDVLARPDHVFYMQVFVEEVGCWMDSMDSQKHFSRILPFRALAEPVLLNALLACGSKHMNLIDPQKHPEETAQDFYTAAHETVLSYLQSPQRAARIELCAMVASVLNVYDVMSEKPLQRFNQIAGARSLIQECGWNARSTGFASACFWLNVGFEVLSCMHYNRRVGWDPDAWGLDLDLDRPPDRDEVWTYRMLYISARIVNFKATPSPQLPLAERMRHWDQLRRLCADWDRAIPRHMRPLGVVDRSAQQQPRALFPEIWVIKRTAIIAQMFYHTAMCLLALANPNIAGEMDQMKALELHHAHQLCGIVVHVKDRGVMSVALRSLSVAAECLTDQEEQIEVIRQFDRISRETGWRIQFLKQELPDKWKWPQHLRDSMILHPPAYSAAPSAPMAPATTTGDPGGINRGYASSGPPPPPGPGPVLGAGGSSAAFDYAAPSQPDHRRYTVAMTTMGPQPGITSAEYGSHLQAPYYGHHQPPPPPPQ